MSDLMLETKNEMTRTGWSDEPQIKYRTILWTEIYKIRIVT